MMKRQLIEFTDMSSEVMDEYAPKPAKREIPDWYKHMEAYIDGKREAYADDRGFSSSTIKKCMPVYDSITAGYIIYSPVDVEVSRNPEGNWFRWPSMNALSFHDHSQVATYPIVDTGSKAPIPKWNNPWAIKTPPGYSCLFTAPMHRESVLKIFDGVVDTDTYFQPVQFPFQLVQKDFLGIIPAGTPIAQVIPFKRESWDHTVQKRIDVSGNSFERVTANLKATFFNGYKDRFWFKKDFN